MRRCRHAARIALTLTALQLGCAQEETRARAGSQRSAVEASPREAEEFVRRFLEVARGSDCEALAAMLVQRPTDCDHWRRDFNGRFARGTTIVSSRRDGRDHSAVLVTTRAEGPRGAEEVILRAELRNGQWKLRI